MVYNFPRLLKRALRGRQHTGADRGIAPAKRRTCKLAVEGLEDRCVPTGGYGVVNLASDVPGLARVTNADLVNPWGLAFSPTGPFWFSDNGSGVSNLLDGRGQVVPLVTTFAGGDSSATGVVYNGQYVFDVTANGKTGSSIFLFAAENGTISGWAPAVNAYQSIVAVDNSASGASYTGLAIATNHFTNQSFLYAADFSEGTIDEFDQNFTPIHRDGAFQDPGIPAGYAPFNIQNIGNSLYVTYAQQDPSKHYPVAGLGLGFVDVYDLEGNLLHRIASQGSLNAPWGLALAPASFGPLGGYLLVGNAGDGHILAYNPVTGAYVGQITDSTNQPIAIPGLWGLSFGNGHMGGDPNTLFFTAGINYWSDGLFGAIQAPENIGADTGGAGTFDPTFPGERADYPLPPMNGPALQTNGGERLVTSSVLLPFADNSLALAPTLTWVASSAAPLAGQASPFSLVAFNRSGPGTMVASASAYIPSESQTSADATQQDVFTLDMFLDLNSARDNVDVPAERQKSPSPQEMSRLYEADPFAEPEAPLAGSVAVVVDAVPANGRLTTVGSQTVPARARSGPAANVATPVPGSSPGRASWLAPALNVFGVLIFAPLLGNVFKVNFRAKETEDSAIASMTKTVVIS